MKHVLQLLLTLFLVLAPGLAAAQLDPVINISSGGITVNGVSVSGSIVAPAGMVTVNPGGNVRGGVVADRLVLKGGGTVEQP